MMKNRLKKCPFCGAEINQKEEENELLEEVNQLKEKGILKQTIFVAVKIVESMSEKNPVWFKEALDRQTEKISKSVERKLREEAHAVLKSIMEIKGNPVAMGRIQEEEIIKRLSSLKTGQDRFRSKGRESQEDIECIVIEDGVEFGKIVVESKRTKYWREKYLQQIEKYVKKENAEFGILATTAMPDDSLNNTVMENDVLIINIDYIELAYIFLREYLKLKKKLEQEYSTKMKNLEVRDQVLEELRKAITSGELDYIIKQMNEITLDIDNRISKTENYLSSFFKAIRKDSSKIREFAETLVREHIEKIRVQLLQQPLPPFLSS